MFKPDFFPLICLLHLKHKFPCSPEEEKARWNTIKKNMNAKWGTSSAAIAKVVAAAAAKAAAAKATSENPKWGPQR